MQYIEKTINKNYVFRGKILTVRRDDALLPDGTPCIREVIEHSGGACVLYVKDDAVALVKQYRYPYEEILYELPAGKLNLGEAPEVAAIRELEEETGIRAKSVKLLQVLYPSPGYTNEKIYIYEATDGENVGAHLDADEFLDVEYLPLSEARERLRRGELKDAKTIVALQAYFLSKTEG